MSVDTKAVDKANKWLSLDSWAVLTAFVLALLIRVGIFKHVPW